MDFSVLYGKFLMKGLLVEFIEMKPWCKCMEFFGGGTEQNPCEPATGNRPSGELAALYPCGKIKSALSARIISKV